MPEPIWLTPAIVLGIHDEVIFKSGGAAGLLSAGLLESAIARPRHRLAYDPDVSLFELAAAYCVGIGKNHAFLDGNKRTGFLVAAEFLELNGWLINPPAPEVVDVMVDVAEGRIGEAEVTAWLSRYSQKRRRRRTTSRRRSRKL